MDADVREDTMTDKQLQQNELRLLQQENAVLQQKQQEMQLQLNYMHHRCQIQQQQVQLADYRTRQIQIKYNNLAESKLGRLTLWVWQFRTALQSARAKGDRWFLLRWLLKPSFRKSIAAAPKQQDMTHAQLNWINDYLERIAAIPDSNGCRYFEKSPYRIGLICDEFFYESISAAADFVFMTPDNWQQELESGLDVMLFVTAWRGLNEEWRGLGSVPDMNKNPARRMAIDILDSCRNKNIPTVFYSKEDPPNFEVFVEYAKHCDYICTTAVECVPRYVEECGHDRVQAVSFGINPVNHNPIGFRRTDKEDTVVFSGSWMLKYPDRCRELALIFDGILESSHGLHIVDRNYPGNPKYGFPEKYFPYTSPALPHDLLQKTHKLFDWAVNINSVKGSHTMFANRAYELQANGVLLLSNYSLGVNELLPTVQIVHDSDEVTRIMDSLTGEALYERQISGIRSVMTGQTCFDRLSQILKPVGFADEQPVRRILVLADEVTESVQRCFDRQTYPAKRLMPVEEISEDVLKQYDMVTWFASDAQYGVFYLEDMANGFKYTACDYITKDAWYEGEILHQGAEHDYVNHMNSKYRTLFWQSAFQPVFLMNLSGKMQLENGYSIDHFNYNAAPKLPGTQKTDYCLSVVIPTCNNGLHLHGKAFSSLLRSTMFRDMEIVLVDGGSTDGCTVKILADLADRYSNVRICCLADMRDAWQKGVSMATAPYVALLEPGSEAIEDGYALLYQKVRDRDLALGNVYQMDVEPVIHRYYDQFVQEIGSDITEHGLKQMTLSPDYVRGMVIRKELLESVHADNWEDFLEKLMKKVKSAAAVDASVVLAYSGSAE